jgi:hypothetical protein
MPDFLQLALNSLVQRGASLPALTRQAAAASLQRYSGAIAQDTIAQAITTLFDGLRSIAHPPREQGTATVGETPATLRAKILEVLKPFGTAPELNEKLDLDFKIKVATEVMQGAGRFVADQTTVEEYPAWEFKRVFSRQVPRGLERPVPSDPWPIRWGHAARESGDPHAMRILRATGRMIALKSSDIWQALGDGAGGYDDALGNPFPPFAFNSGFETEGVSRKEAIELGLLKADEQPRPSAFDFSQLISLPEAA